MGIRGLGMTASILVAVVASSIATAADGFDLICPLVLHQEQVNREEREIAVDLAVSRLAAAESIFDLVDRLWKEEAVQRIVYLAAKHDRDVAAINVKRQRLRLKRQEAESEQYAIACASVGSEEAVADRRERFNQALERYLQADCHRIGKELAIAEVDLAYSTEVLVSVRDLRENSVGTRQDVIRAERDVALAGKRVEHHRRRVQACIDSGVAGGGGR